MVCFRGVVHFWNKCLTFIYNRINKRGSQKDAEQKKSGNYFFYEDENDVDDDDL
jgi:hypothetical protein